MTHIRSTIRSTGHYLPEKVLTNKDLEQIVDTSDEWITQRSGIKSRHIAADDQRTSDLAIAAAQQALDNANLSPSDIDGILVATTTPDSTFPSTAVKVQSALGIPACMAFDLQAVCSGFVYGLSIADKFIISGQNKRILLIGAEKMSSIVDWEDRTTCVLFADGAGAVILEAKETEEARAFYQRIFMLMAIIVIFYTPMAVFPAHKQAVTSSCMDAKYSNMPSR